MECRALNGWCYMERLRKCFRYRWDHTSTRSPPLAASEWKYGRMAGFRRVLTRKTWAHARQAGMGPKHFKSWEGESGERQPPMENQGKTYLEPNIRNIIGRCGAGFLARRLCGPTVSRPCFGVVADKLNAFILRTFRFFIRSKRPVKEHGFCHFCHSAYARDSGTAGRPWSDD